MNDFIHNYILFSILLGGFPIVLPFMAAYFIFDEWREGQPIVPIFLAILKASGLLFAILAPGILGYLIGTHIPGITHSPIGLFIITLEAYFLLALLYVGLAALGVPGLGGDGD